VVVILLSLALVGVAVWGQSWKHTAEDLMYALVKVMEEKEDES
jgi:hypothetical protein